MLYVDDAQLDRLAQEAAGLPRRRKNLNLHADLADKVQRLFIAMQPGSYVRPHRHTGATKTELFMVIRGGFDIFIFSEMGEVLERYELRAEGPGRVLEMPPGTWHTVLAQTDGSIFFEVKQGPFTPLSDKDFAGWAPEEGAAEVMEFVQWLQHAQVGERPPGP